MVRIHAHVLEPSNSTGELRLVLSVKRDVVLVDAILDRLDVGRVGLRCDHHIAVARVLVDTRLGQEWDPLRLCEVLSKGRSNEDSEGLLTPTVAVLRIVGAHTHVAVGHHLSRHWYRRWKWKLLAPEITDVNRCDRALNLTRLVEPAVAAGLSGVSSSTTVANALVCLL